MQTKVTYEAVFTFLTASHVWLNKDKENEKTKFGYALLRMRTRAEKLWNKYQSLVEDLNIDSCVADEKGVIVRDERGGYKFTKEELKKKNRKQQELFESEIEIEPYFAKEVPSDLTFSESFAFTNFVLREQIEEEVEETEKEAMQAVN